MFSNQISFPVVLDPEMCKKAKIDAEKLVESEDVKRLLEESIRFLLLLLYSCNILLKGLARLDRHWRETTWNKLLVKASFLRNIWELLIRKEIVPHSSIYDLRKNKIISRGLANTSETMEKFKQSYRTQLNPNVLKNK